MTKIRTIVVPFDFSRHSEAALDFAHDLAGQLDAELHLLHVVKPVAYAYASDLDMGLSSTDSFDTLQESYRRDLERAAAKAGVQPDRLHVHVVESAQIPSAIDTEAERLGADLIAMGTHGRTGLAHAVMGSVAEATTRRAPCPVMTVPCEAARIATTARWEASRHPPVGSF